MGARRRSSLQPLQSARRDGGQSLVEFALVMPLLIALLVAIMAFAWIGFSYLSISSATRMGTRHMISYPVFPKDPERFATSDQEITYIVTSAMPFVDWQRADITIWPPVEARTPDLEMSVSIVYEMDLPTVQVPFIVTEGYLVLLPPITLFATSAMRLD